MIGPLGISGPGTEAPKAQADRPREQTPIARPQAEEQAARTAATEEARGNRAAVVEEAAELRDGLRRAAEDNRSRLRIEQDKDTGRFIYKSVDTQTGEVVREWPEEEMRRALEVLQRFRGALLDETT